MLLALQVIVDTFAEGTGTFSVNDTDGFHVCDIGVIQIFIQLCNCLIYGFSEKIDLCGNAGCLGHTDLSGAGTLHGRSGDHRLVHKLQIGDMNLGTYDTHLHKEISFGIRMTGNCSFQIQAEHLYGIAKRKIGWLQLFLWLLLLLSGRHSIFGF